MPLFKVEETRTVFLTHIIKAESAAEAQALMGCPHKGLVDVTEDDSHVEHTAVEVRRCACDGKKPNCPHCDDDGWQEVQ